ncbi:MAG TPA: glycerate kinase [Casimicrobiaceae bacterium]|nr:glycerate kinase [Casimicrobiaceae bacterium]
MLRIVLAPDSFKGSLDAPQVCAALATGLKRVLPDADIRSRPMADGGEGTLDAVLAAVGASGRRQHCVVHGAGGATISADYGLLESREGMTAVLEIAKVVGITDPAGMAANVGSRTTRGVGELIVHQLDHGVRRFMVGLGGSSTNDGGAGLLSALGVKLLDSGGRQIAPGPEGLAALSGLDAFALDPRLRDCAITIMSDVNNPLTGEQGATAIFGPQKGVTPAQIRRYDDAIARFAERAEAAIGRRAAGKPGAGAAGGLGFALQLLDGNFHSGAAVVADLIGLDAALADADWAITGEGRSDAQTLLRKAPFVVAERAAAHAVPVTLVSGAVDARALPVLGRHFAGCFALPNGPSTLNECIANAGALLAERAEQIARVLIAGRMLRH